MRKVIMTLLLVCSISIQAQTNDLNQEEIESFKARCDHRGFSVWSRDYWRQKSRQSCKATLQTEHPILLYG